MSITRLNDFDYGPALKLLRESNKFSKAHVARETELSASSVGNHEIHGVCPSMYSLSNYCTLYDIEIYELFHLMAHIKSGHNPKVTSDVSKYAIRHMIHSS